MRRFGSLLETSEMEVEEGGAKASKEIYPTLQQEAQQCCTFLGKHLEGELAASTESAGLDRTDGSTRSLVVQQREGLRHEVLTLWPSRGIIK
jgi:hypothetical protein